MAHYLLVLSLWISSGRRLIIQMAGKMFVLSCFLIIMRLSALSAYSSEMSSIYSVCIQQSKYIIITGQLMLDWCHLVILCTIWVSLQIDKSHFYRFYINHMLILTSTMKWSLSLAPRTGSLGKRDFFYLTILLLSASANYYVMQELVMTS